MKFNVPTARYGYALAAAQCTDHIEVQVLPQGSSGNAGLARLILDPQSPGSPANQGNNLSLTSVRVSITAPRCGLATLIPKKEDVADAGFCGAGQTAFWTVGNVFKGNAQQYSVNYVMNGPSDRRFEFMLQAAELPDPIRLQIDVTGAVSS
jgi:hypothetical protein